MSDFRSIVRAVRDRIAAAARKSAELARRFAVWISPPPRLCAAGILVVFLASFLSWAVGVRTWHTVFYFPTRNSTALRGEVHALPRAWKLESRAELIASEYVLGPIDGARERSAFALGTRVESVLYRAGTLYVDLSPETALLPAADLALGLKGLGKTLDAGLPRVRRLVLTIGGTEPWKEGLDTASGKAGSPSAAAGDDPKKSKKN